MKNQCSLERSSGNFHGSGLGSRFADGSSDRSIVGPCPVPSAKLHNLRIFFAGSAEPHMNVLIAHSEVFGNLLGGHSGFSCGFQIFQKVLLNRSPGLLLTGFGCFFNRFGLFGFFRRRSFCHKGFCRGNLFSLEQSNQLGVHFCKLCFKLFPLLNKVKCGFDTLC